MFYMMSKLLPQPKKGMKFQCHDLGFGAANHWRSGEKSVTRSHWAGTNVSGSHRATVFVCMKILFLLSGMRHAYPVMFNKEENWSTMKHFWKYEKLCLAQSGPAKGPRKAPLEIQRSTFVGYHSLVEMHYLWQQYFTPLYLWTFSVVSVTVLFHFCKGWALNTGETNNRVTYKADPSTNNLNASIPSEYTNGNFVKTLDLWTLVSVWLER